MKNYRNCWKTATAATTSVVGGKLTSAPEGTGLKMSELAKQPVETQTTTWTSYNVTEVLKSTTATGRFQEFQALVVLGGFFF